LPSAPGIDKELLLLGGGHAHVAVIRHFAMSPRPGLGITLLSREVHTPYSGMLPGLVAGHYRHDECHIDLRRLCEASGVRLIQGSAQRIDTAAQRVEMAGRPALHWDLLSINTGSRPAIDSIEGAVEHGIAVKPIDRFLLRWSAFLQALEADNVAREVCVVGGGAASVEIVLALAHRLRSAGVPGDRCRLSLVAAAPRPLEGQPASLVRRLERHLSAAGIDVLTDARVLRATDGALELADGRRIPCDLAVWAIHAGAPAWLGESGLPVDARGFVRVNAGLGVEGQPRIFAVGDIAALPQAVPKSGVYAVREGPVLARNIARVLAGKASRPYRAQRRALAILATGPRHAVAARGAWVLSGDWVWRWKDRIDRRFMAMYAPAALPPPRPGEQPEMPCGGCAAKIGADTLGSALTALGIAADSRVLHGIGSAEDAAVMAVPAGQLLVQSVDYFRAFTRDAWLLGRIGAVHALGDIHAMGATPHSALAIATVARGAGPRQGEELAQLMAGARSALDDEGVVLAGGHSSEGEESGFGLCVNGFATQKDLLLKSGLRPGQALLLTKALGSGVLLAANMAAAVPGRHVASLFASMQHGQGAALPVLRAHGVTACTDVTGFGLLGHLAEMLRASGIGARLRCDALPALPGARECLAAGYRSSLHEANARQVEKVTEGSTDAVTLGLLLDPQTAGGLLAGVPREAAAPCLAALRAGGFPDAECIGETDATLSPGRLQLG
jgi:selenide,water dikinase